MNGFKQCPNGHFYQESLGKCPYCQNANGDVRDNKTEVINLGSNSEGPTEAQPTIGNSVTTGTKTQIFGDSQTETQTMPTSQRPKTTHTRTVFGDEIIESSPDGTQRVKFQQRSTRKLVGWLVSYSFDPMGVDFKLFEGRNIIGRDVDCNVTVNDGLMSGKHAVLLYKNDRYKISDNMSTHGTFVNNVDIEDEHFELHDGDVIQLGGTVFKFRTSL